MPSIKEDAPVRSVMEVGAGDFIKVGGQCHSMFGINRYAKKKDIDNG